MLLSERFAGLQEMVSDSFHTGHLQRDRITAKTLSPFPVCRTWVSPPPPILTIYFFLLLQGKELSFSFRSKVTMTPDIELKSLKSQRTSLAASRCLLRIYIWIYNNGFVFPQYFFQLFTSLPILVSVSYNL